MKIKKIFFAFLFLPLQCLAWGPIGHCTVGLIAEANLTPQAKNAISKILGGQSLGDVANWADSLKSTGDYRQAIWYHFEKIPDNVKYLDNLNAQSAKQKTKGGVVAAILVANDTLRKTTATAREQTDALKFLVHFVGDIHQPLHTGRPEDNGGVKVDTVWFGMPMSLHKIWDSGMIGSGHGDIFTDSQPLNQVTQVYANYLVQKFSGTSVNTAMDVETWLNESLALRAAAYDKLYESDPVQYQKMHLPEIDLRIYSAGLRLAHMINDIYANSPVPKTEMNLWQDIENILGDLYSVIRLNP